MADAEDAQRGENAAGVEAPPDPDDLLSLETVAASPEEAIAEARRRWTRGWGDDLLAVECSPEPVSYQWVVTGVLRPGAWAEWRAKSERWHAEREASRPKESWLEEFLWENELDNLLIKQTCADFTEAQEERVRSVLDARTPRQARYNLLMHPRMIPAEIRVQALVAPFEEKAPDPWMVLAATVGLQGAYVSHREWPSVLRILLGRLGTAEDTIANRILITIAGHARAADVPAILDVARTMSARDQMCNVLGLALRNGATDNQVAPILKAALQAAGDDETRDWLARWLATGRRPDGLPIGMQLPTLGYIPNLDTTYEPPEAQGPASEQVRSRLGQWLARVWRR